MHIACEMGAANIILVGCDCGTLDGKFYFPELTPRQTVRAAVGLPEFSEGEFAGCHVGPDALQKHYGVLIYSLNPFVNLNLEGHKFEGPGI